MEGRDTEKVPVRRFSTQIRNYREEPRALIDQEKTQSSS
jgi:hypothetical protein